MPNKENRGLLRNIHKVCERFQQVELRWSVEKLLSQRFSFRKIVLSVSFLLFLLFPIDTIAAQNPTLQIAPQEVSPKELVVISSSIEIFDSDRSENSVIFPGTTEDIIPLWVSSNKKTIIVVAPDKVEAGSVSLQVKQVKRGDVSVTVKPKTEYKAFAVVYGITIALFLLIALIVLSTLKKAPKWHLGEALSEQAHDTDDKPLIDNKEPKLISSSSRLIGLIGLSAILAINLGIAAMIFWGYFINKEILDLSKIGWYLFGQAAIFAPYIVNQARSAFK
jgi:hypothetical protein